MKTNGKLVKAVSGVVATSILTASCTQYAPIGNSIFENQSISEFDLGKIAIPISINLKGEDV
jgi:hypothetical protein